MIALALALFAQQEADLKHKIGDLEFEAKIAMPAGDVTRVIVLVHGSGLAGMDLDLTAASKDGKTKILFFKDLSDALVARGFAVLRYHKRNYQIVQLGKKIKEEKRQPTDAENAIMKSFQEHPLQSFVEDCKAFATLARERFPKAAVYLLGASEGTHVTLWAANELDWIAGVALLGYYSQSLEATMFEQVVHRSMVWFAKTDADHDGKLTMDEMKAGGDPGKRLLLQTTTLDVDKDEKIDESEYRSACLTNLIAQDPLGTAYRSDEAKYPTTPEVLKKAKFKVAFFQGTWDNQTPAYNAMGVELLAKYSWKKKGFTFRYFPKLGHGLDPRDAYDDIYYRPSDPGALKVLAEDLKEQFSP